MHINNINNIDTAPVNNFNPGDFIEIFGSKYNDGIYKVLSYDGSTTINFDSTYSSINYSNFETKTKNSRKFFSLNTRHFHTNPFIIFCSHYSVVGTIKKSVPHNTSDILKICYNKK